MALIVFLLVAFNPAEAGTKHYTLVSGESDFYFGYISYIPTEPAGRLPEVLRAGLPKSETASLNFPLGPGDLITTYDLPCEIQFDSGTIIRLERESKLKIETIMAESLSSGEQLSNLILEKGQAYLMYTAYNSWETFQLLTPNSALKMKNHTVAMIGVTEGGETKLSVKEGKVSVLYGPSGEQLRSAQVREGESLVVSQNHRLEKKDYFQEFKEFETWNVELNKRFLELHKGVTPLPKPIQKLPAAVFYFAQRYSNQYGEWLWDDYYGYVWRPFYNDVYPWGNWSPYVYGRWTYLNGSLFWVPGEPWGWVPYHLGIWQWDEKKGWVWIPGSAFAPAWAAWDFYMGYYAWRPWMLTDWLGYGYYGYDPYLFSSYYDTYVGLNPGQYVGQEVLSKVTRNQLKRPQTQIQSIPESYKKLVTNLSKALERHDPEVARRVGLKYPEPMVVKADDLSAGNIHEKRVPIGELIEKIKDKSAGPVNRVERNGGDSGWDQRIAIAAYLKSKKTPNNISSDRNLKGEIKIDADVRQENRSVGQASPPGARKENVTAAIRQKDQIPSASNLRFRDWNPDLKMARELGVRIIYDSFRNLVVSPELGLTSREARAIRNGLRSSGFGHYGSYSGPAASSNSPSSSASGESSSTSSSPSSSSHSSGRPPHTGEKK